MPIVSQGRLHAALERLMEDPMCDFTLAVTAYDSGLAYTQIRYFYSLWSLGLEAKLEDLYVVPEAQRQGLGSQLLTFSIEQARQRQCRLIGLNTNEGNIAAKSLYIQNGFSCQPSRWQSGQQLWFEKIL
ncbi:GNAT family N-acetyltransferase [Acaryochloris marina NIES-2412]|uniref:GNAT family N-acetyltransferase n=1 Tax=Acaryochloris marina TaxID=155978 RepID=UPI0040591502